MRVQVLEWDSQFFGFPVGRLLELDSTDSAQAIQECVRKAGCRVVYVGTTEEKPELYEHYILTQVELHSSLRVPDQWSVLATQPVGETEGAAPSLVLQPYEGTADESLVQLALQAGWPSVSAWIPALAGQRSSYSTRRGFTEVAPRSWRMSC